MTAYERTGWRDMRLSLRHRDWGFDCPAVDLDFLMLEYNIGYPVAVVDYKHYQAAPPNLGGASHKAAGRLYNEDGEQLPYLIARYWPETWAFRVVGANKAGQRLAPTWLDMSERDYVAGLYKLREITISEKVLAILNTQKPPSEAAA